MSYPLCTECRRPMRQPGEPKGEHPGTVARRGITTCDACVRRSQRAKKMGAPGIRPCPECGNPTHQGKTADERPPGVQRRIGDGLCVSCYHARRRDRMRSGSSEYADISTIPYIQFRRNRGIPSEGIRTA